MQGFRAGSWSVKSEREGAQEMLLEFFQDKQPECVTYAKQLAEASKIFLLSCNFKSPESTSTFLGGELGATPLMDELDESEKSAVLRAALHRASCVDLFLKKLGRTDCASVLLAINLRTTRLVYELEPDKSAVCVAVFLARKDCTLALLGRELGATPLEEFEVVLQNDHTDRMAAIWAPHDCGVDSFFAVALSEENKVYVHYNAKTIDLTSSQDKRFMLLKKTSVSNSVNQHKCPTRLSCNALPIITEDDAVTKRILWLPIKHGARVSQKDKLGLTFFFAILLPGWIPVVDAVDDKAFLRGTISTCTWFWIIIITIASAYCAYKVLRRSPPEPYLFSEKVKIWKNGEMNVKVYDDEGILVGSWRCALSTENGDAVDITEWVTNLLNFVLEIHVPQEDGRVKEISFNQMDDPEFIGMPKDVYLHNPDTGLLRYIGRSVPQNGAPSERDILRIGDDPKALSKLNI